LERVKLDLTRYDQFVNIRGTASYTKTFDLPEGLRGGKQSIYLDLGDVKDMAEVTLNGTTLGVPGFVTLPYFLKRYQSVYSWVTGRFSSLRKVASA
jgi:hypothetical protein